MNFFFLSQVLSALGVGFGSLSGGEDEACGEDEVERTLNFFFLKSVDLLLEWLLVLALTGGKWRE